MCGEIEVGRCECCGKDNVPLERTYFRYPFECECHSPEHFILVRHCEDCDPIEPRETKVVFKTEDLKNEYEKLCKMYPIDEADYLVSADVFADWYEFPRSLFEETELFHTVDGTFRIPKQYAELLTLVYKDYMSIPDLDTRIHEVMTHFNYLKFMENV